MHPLTLEGYITEDGELRVQLPPDIAPGRVQVTLAPVPEADWTDEELAALMQPEPKSGAEIVALGHTGGWEHLDIADGVAWEEEQRRKRKAHQG